MKSRLPQVAAGLVAVILLLAIIAPRLQRHLSPREEGGAKQKTTAHMLQHADGQSRTGSSTPSSSLARLTTGTRTRSVSVTSATAYSLTQTAFLPYGNGRQQLGRIANGDVKAGPESFWVDKNGLMYVCDTVNEKIKVLSPSGELLEERSIGSPVTDLVVADSGDMFVLDMSRRTVEQIGPDGSRKASLELKGTLADSAARLRVNGNEVALQTNEQYEVVLTQDGKADLKNEISGNSAQVGLKGLDGKRFQTLRTEAREGQVTIYNESGAIIRQQTLPVDGMVGSIMFLGQDRADNSYFQVETSAANGVELSVYRLDANGNVSGVIPQMPNDYSSWTAKLLEVDGEGNIHQMLPTADGVIVNVWRWS